MSHVNPPLARRAFCSALALGALGLSAPAMAAGDATYPNKPIIVYVPFPAGSATDAMLRILGPIISKALGGQPVVIENRPGASGTLAASLVALSKRPDGYQLAVAPATLFKVPHMQKVPYDPMKDLTYIAAFASYTYGLVVPGDSPWKNLDDFIAGAKAARQPLSIATTGTGSSGHAATMLLAKKTGIELLSVPFKGGSEVLQAFMGGHVQGVIDGGWAQNVRTGHGRALVTFSEKRLIPDVPTARELGIDLVTYSPIGLIGPKGMAPKIVQKLQDVLLQAIQAPEFKKTLQDYDLGETSMTSVEYRKVAERLWVDEKKNLEMLGLIGGEDGK